MSKIKSTHEIKLMQEAGQIAAAQLQGQAVNDPDQHAAQGAQQAALSVDVEDDAEAQTANGAGEQPPENGHFHDRTANRCAPQKGSGIPGGGGAGDDGSGDEQNLHDPVGTGVNVSENDIPHGVGKQ